MLRSDQIQTIVELLDGSETHDNLTSSKLNSIIEALGGETDSRLISEQLDVIIELLDGEPFEIIGNPIVCHPKENSNLIVSALGQFEKANIRRCGKNITEYNGGTYSIEHFYFDVPFEISVVSGVKYIISFDAVSDVVPFSSSIGLGTNVYKHDEATVYATENVHRSISYIPSQENIDLYGDKLFFRPVRYGASTVFNAIVSNVQIEIGDSETSHEAYIANDYIVIPDERILIPSLEGINTLMTDVDSINVKGKKEKT